jgi:hypothetical protein
MRVMNNEKSVVMAIFLPLTLRSSPAFHVGFLEACLKKSLVSPFHVGVAANRAWPGVSHRLMHKKLG